MNKFETEEGKQLLSYLQEKLGVEVVSTNQNLAHLKRNQKDSFIVGTIKTVMEAERKYPRIFTEDFFLLFEYPSEPRVVKFALYCLSWEQRVKLIKKFGGRELINCFWIVANTEGLPFGYTGKKLPESADIIESIENASV